MNLRSITIIACTFLLQTQTTQSSGKSVGRKRALSQSAERPSKKQLKRK